MATKEVYAAIKRQLKDIGEIFNSLDEKGEGYITGKQFKILLHCCGQNPTKEECSKLLKCIGKTDKCQVTFEEFQCVLASPLLIDDPYSDLGVAFRTFDKAGDGHIAMGDLTAILSSNGNTHQTEVARFISQCETNTDGKVSYKDIMELWTNAVEKRNESPSSHH